jgi:amidase
MTLTDAGTGPAAMVKDTLDVAGAPTRAGSRALADAPPAGADADAVALLRRAGWRITGKTKLHELAFGTTGLNAHDGTPLNPGWPDRVPGGSSSGSAAVVAAGLVGLALGTDTGGSVRVPACCCGVIGLKPTFGLVSRRGVLPTHTSLDCVGPFARDMTTLIDAMRALVPGFTVPTVPESLRVGVLQVVASAPVARAVASALQALADAGTAVLQPVNLPRMQAAYEAGLAVINAESWAASGALLATGRVGADVAGRLEAASRTTAADVAAAERVRERFTAEVDALLDTCTVLALPTMPDVPPRLVDATDTRAAVGMTALVRPFNLSGHPALSLPLRTAEGLPAGLQLVARRGADGLLCAVAALVAERLRLICSPFDAPSDATLDGEVPCSP